MKAMLLILVTLAASAHAQITNPDALVAPAPQPHAQSTAPELRSADLQWLWQYTKPEPTGNKSALFADPRFAALIRAQLTTPQSFWGTKRLLSEAVSDFLAGEGFVTTQNNRYLTVSGCIADQCGQKGLLWFDLGTSRPLMVFVAKRWIEESKTPDEKGAPFQYWLFANRNAGSGLPASLKAVLNHWAGAEDCVSATQSGGAVIVDTDGTPHVTSSSQIGIHSTHCKSNS